MNNPLFNNTVAVVEAGTKEYPTKPPFGPPEPFPELSQLPFSVGLDPENHVYKAVREALILLGLDKENIGTEQWNPLGELVSSGDKVVIKPNFALDYHRGGETVLSMIVHASVLRPILDYIQIALKGVGEVMVADAPVTDAKFENLVKVNGIRETLDILNRYYPLRVRLADLRRMIVKGYEQNNLFLKRIYQDYGMKHSRIVNLGKASAFYNLAEKEKLYYGADFDRRVPRKHHHGDIQEYSIATDILEADVVISVPKMKTHKTAGVTLNIKNMIGINTDKNFLPHYRIGEPSEGGDEFPDSGNRWIGLKSKMARGFLDIALGYGGFIFARPVNILLSAYRRMVLKQRAKEPTVETADLIYRKLLQRPIRCGHWWGNDTLWRVGADLNKILIYADKSGVLQKKPQRKYFSIMDGIIGGEGKGPMVPIPRRAGLILAGFNPIALDRTAVALMGFDYRKVPIIQKVMDSGPPPLCHNGEPMIKSNVDKWKTLPGYDNSLKFKPAPNWKGYIENF